MLDIMFCYKMLLYIFFNDITITDLFLFPVSLKIPFFTKIVTAKTVYPHFSL